MILNATATELYNEVVNRDGPDGTFAEFGITVIEVVAMTSHYPRRDLRFFVYLREDTIWAAEVEELTHPRRYKRTKIVQTGSRNHHIRQAIKEVDAFNDVPT